MIAAASDAALQRHPGALHVAIPEDPAVRVVFTGREDADGAANVSLVVGEGDVAAVRRRALDALGLPPGAAVFMEQVHGGDVARVTHAEAGRGLEVHAEAIPGVDGLVTDEDGLALVVLTADCVPVLLVDPGRAVGAVHAGRRGVAAEVVPTAVRALAGGATGEVVAVIGPSIGGCCYEVPAAMADELAAVWPQARAATTWGTPSLDLRAAVTAQLESCGVTQVRQVGGCTSCNADRFFSHRATTGARAPAGRQAGIVLRRAAGGRTGVAPAQPRQSTSLESPSSS